MHGLNIHNAHRYGFQGQERDDEVKGAGISINYKYRMHDPRLGRLFAVDPLTSKYPYNSPYAFTENRLIDGVELEGLEVALVGKQVTASFLLSGTTGGGVVMGPDGIKVYGEIGFGFESDMAISTNTSVTVIPTMPSIHYACG